MVPSNTPSPCVLEAGEERVLRGSERDTAQPSGLRLCLHTQRAGSLGGVETKW